MSPLLRALAAESRPDVEEAMAQIRAYPSLDRRTALGAVRALALDVNVPLEGSPQPVTEEQRQLLCEIIVFAAHALR